MSQNQKNWRSENMRRLNADPVFAAARDASSRATATKNQKRMQYLARIARRGVIVPKAREKEWRSLKGLRLSNREVAQIMGLRWLGPQDDAADLRHAHHRLQALIDDAQSGLSALEASKSDEDDWSALGNTREALADAQRLLDWLQRPTTKPTATAKKESSDGR